VNYTDAQERLALIRAVRPALDDTRAALEMAHALIPHCDTVATLKRALDDEATYLAGALWSADIQF
jgi:hypothetical protein